MKSKLPNSSFFGSSPARTNTPKLIPPLSGLILTFVHCLIFSTWTPLAATAEVWEIPVAGNVFKSAPARGKQGISRSGTLEWDDPQSVYSIYFHVNRPASLKLDLSAEVDGGTSRLEVRVGKDVFPVQLGGSSLAKHSLGQVEIPEAGYVRVDIQGKQRAAKNFAKIHQLIVSSNTPELQLDFVKSNKGNMFYWGRRGPSVHLRYEVPKDRPLRYAYTEINVPEGEDPIGSFFMANGFGEGYFGFQVNGPEERRILFSVWSPFKTDNPKDIPQDQQIIALARGSGVHIGEFGNEGSGGQSYLVYPWVAGKTYRFLTRVEPDGDGNTVYTAWFGDKARDTWRLIASFSRPKTDTDLKGFHSFLENFSPSRGHLGRRAHYGNVWVRDTEAQWHECTQARFSVDATGRGRHRLDFLGGTFANTFFLQNCGFFSDTGNPGTVFTRGHSGSGPPSIDFEKLPLGAN